jgi:hypothetical protein
MRRRTPGVPPRMDTSGERVAAAFSPMRQRYGKRSAPADACFRPYRSSREPPLGRHFRAEAHTTVRDVGRAGRLSHPGAAGGEGCTRSRPRSLARDRQRPPQSHRRRAAPCRCGGQGAPGWVVVHSSKATGNPPESQGRRSAPVAGRWRRSGGAVARPLRDRGLRPELFVSGVVLRRVGLAGRGGRVLDELGEGGALDARHVHL